MPKRLLIDASHREQVRVVTLDNSRVTEYDGETVNKQQLKGNIYLAKVTRIEPSLQAAFVDYGRRNHGFVPFSEIHPDYYQIPAEDRQRILDSMQGIASDEPDDDSDDDIDTASQKDDDDEIGSHNGKNEDDVDEDDTGSNIIKKSQLHKRYKIQDVIKRGQILLLQVEKEERGNKGAALTSFISLAGKYCVLMPKSLKAGGVSRKIASGSDRRRLKEILYNLEVAQGWGLIIRTAGSGKSGAQITADYTYLAELWGSILKATYSSCAPAFIHAEEDVVRRSIRDLYDDSYDEVLIEGDEAYASAQRFIKKIIPEHEEKVRKYDGKLPLFTRFKVEEQINAFYDHEAPLESGGSIVLWPTEALVSVDVNSGKSTSQRDVEETALTTNVEAAHEIARQLRLRDLSGLIVIDFIDMMDYRNRRTVERALRDAFSNDRARVQIGKISTFGLLEMSRQRLRPTLWEMTTQPCPTCRGTGVVKSSGAVAVQVLRAIEQEASRSGAKGLKVTVHVDVTTYMLNHKRQELRRIEDQYDMQILFAQQQSDKQNKNSYSIQRLKIVKDDDEEPATTHIPASAIIPPDGEHHDPVDTFRGGNTAEQRRARPENGRVSARSERNKKFRETQAKRTPAGFSQLLEGLWQKIID